MNKKLIVSFLSFVSCFCLFAQTEGNKAFQLNVNNGDAYLDCGDVSELNNTSQYTIETWVNVTLSDLPDRFIIFKKEPTETNRIKVQVEKNGQIYVMQSNGGDGAFAQTPVGTYPESGWHHIALVYDGEKGTSGNGAMILYIDGVKQPLSDATFKGTTGNMEGSFAVGGPALNVQYDEVRIWNKAMEAVTIMEWKGCKVLDSHPDKEALAAYYDFQNVSGTEVPDLAGQYPAVFEESEASILDTELAILEKQPEPIAINNGFKLNVNNGDAYLDCGDVSELNNTSQYTIETWVNVTLSDLPDRFIIFKKEPTETNRIKVQVEKNGQIYVMQSNGGDGAFAQAPAGTYPESGWHHIALVYDGGKGTSGNGAMILYIDGVEQSISDATFKGTTGNMEGSFAVGGPALNVQYDEVRIWNKALAAKVISEWKNYKIGDSHPDKNNLVAYYDFENISGTQVPDLVGNYPAMFESNEAEILLNDLALYEKDDIPTEIENSIVAEPETLQTVVSGGEITLIASVPQNVYIYNLAGRLVLDLRISAGETVVRDLPKGFYVVNRQKVILR